MVSGKKKQGNRKTIAVLEITCREVWLAVSGYIDGDVEPDLKERLELHFQKCKHCQAVLNGMTNTVELLTDGDWYPLPDRFSERLYQTLAKKYTKPKKT